MRVFNVLWTCFFFQKHAGFQRTLEYAFFKESRYLLSSCNHNGVRYDQTVLQISKYDISRLFSHKKCCMMCTHQAQTRKKWILLKFWFFEIQGLFLWVVKCALWVRAHKKNCLETKMHISKNFSYYHLPQHKIGYRTIHQQVGHSY